MSGLKCGACTALKKWCAKGVLGGRREEEKKQLFLFVLKTFYGINYAARGNLNKFMLFAYNFKT